MTRPEAVVRGLSPLLREGGRLVAELGGRRNIAIIEGALRAALEAEGVPRGQQAPVWFFPSAAEYAALLEAYALEPRMLALFDRPTPLEGGEGGLATWLRMFAASLLAGLPSDRLEAVVRRVENATRAELWHEDRWVVDYRRLRVFAVRIDER